jgi:glycosyltransferase involved in cell wall biosynthesis
MQSFDIAAESNSLKESGLAPRVRTNRKVLMVTGDFVPVTSNNTFRALGFVEELPELGWDPIVLTKNPEQAIWSIDSGLESSCPTYQVTGSVTIWRMWKKFVKNTLFERIIPESLVADRGRSWIPFAVAKGVGLVLWHRIPVIFGSYQPLPSIVTAYLISKITKRPLIAEFRDPVLSAFGGFVSNRRLELARRIAKHAKRTVVTSEEISLDISKLADGDLKNPPAVLHHGFRLVDLKSPYIPEIQDKFVLTFTGTFYDHKCLDTLCEAISNLIHDNPELKGHIILKVIGRQKNRSFELMQQRAAVFEVQQYLEFLPWQSQLNLQAIIEESHIVWCTDTLRGAGEGIIIPGKLAKLFACGRPVLAFCRPEGATWRAVNETAAGETFDYLDSTGVHAYILKIYQTAVNGGGPYFRNDSALDSYSFRSLAAKLAECFAAEGG